MNPIMFFNYSRLDLIKNCLNSKKKEYPPKMYILSFWYKKKGAYPVWVSKQHIDIPTPQISIEEMENTSAEFRNEMK